MHTIFEFILALLRWLCPWLTWFEAPAETMLGW
mgnify:CR=1 FL=1